MTPIDRIRSGKDIFPIGSIVPSPHGSMKIIGKRVFNDYVEYRVEAAIIETVLAKPSRLRRLYESARRVALTPVKIPKLPFGK